MDLDLHLKVIDLFEETNKLIDKLNIELSSQEGKFAGQSIALKNNHVFNFFNKKSQNNKQKSEIYNQVGYPRDRLNHHIFQD